MKKRLSTTLVLLLLSPLALAASLQLKSPEQQVGLLELYTSEGCSSCPPAERWLSGLKDNVHLWKDIVPIAFHVDYWDYIGWKDRFASPEYSTRQRNYARERLLEAVYTPGFLYNGKEWRRWFSRRDLEFPEAQNTGVLAVDVQGEVAQVRFKPTATTHRNVNINIALIGFGVSTVVRSGENKGRTLSHDFVVLAMNQEALQPEGTRFIATVDMPRSKIDAPRYGVVAWISANDSQRPIQTVGGMLPD